MLRNIFSFCQVYFSNILILFESKIFLLHQQYSRKKQVFKTRLASAPEINQCYLIVILMVQTAFFRAFSAEHTNRWRDASLSVCFHVLLNSFMYHYSCSITIYKQSSDCFPKREMGSLGHEQCLHFQKKLKKYN